MCGPSPCGLEHCTWSERYRAICEARTVMRWKKADREDFYGAVRKNRGAVAMQALVDEVKKQWEVKEKRGVRNEWR